MSLSIFDEATKKIFILDLVVDASDVVDVLAVVAVVVENGFVSGGGSGIGRERGSEFSVSSSVSGSFHACMLSEILALRSLLIALLGSKLSQYCYG